MDFFRKGLFFFLLAGILFANDIKDPFFGYKTFKQVEETPTEDKFDKFNIVITDKLLDGLTPSEYKILLENVKEIAVKRQNEQDIKNFLVMKNYTEKKADTFMNKTQLIALQNQEYDLSLNIDKSKFAKNVRTQANKSQDQDFWGMIKENSIIVVFYDEKKEVDNRAVELVLNYVYQEKGLQAQFISINDEFGKQFAKENNIIFAPDIWILYKAKKPIWHRLASGLITQNRVYEQIQFVYENVIKKELEK